MAKTRISEFDVDPANNTDINSINIAEGCAPSGINNAIRQLMSDLKEFQTGAGGDPFNGAVNGTVGATTPASGAFTTLSASSTLTVTGAGSIQGLRVGRGAGAVSTNTAVGASALNSNTSGASNTAIGYVPLFSNTTGNSNIAVGQGSMYNNTTGGNNVAVGVATLEDSTTGNNNTAIGLQALKSNITASNNTAVGYQAGYANTTGTENQSFGYKALYATTTSSGNNAFGTYALNANTTGANNTALGNYALGLNTTASNNTAVGYQAGYTSTGSANVFIGHSAGISNTTGTVNTFIGASSGDVMTTGTKNVIIGRFSGNQGGLDIRTASNYVVLSDGDGTPRAYWDNSGYLYSIGVYNGTTGSAANVHVTSSGGIFRSTSSLKYKRDVQNATHGLNEVMQLRPVTYKGKSENDGETVFGGLIAEEVHEAGLTEFVQYAEDGSPDALAYGNMVSLCVKAIQELKAEVDSLKQQINNGV